MIFLLFSILFSSAFILTFRFFGHPKIVALHAIVINYFIGAALCFWFSPQKSLDILKSAGTSSVFWNALAMGLLFILVISLISSTTLRLGVTVTAIANKMSFAIPVMVSVCFYGDDINSLKGAGMILAVSAVVLSSLKKEKLHSVRKGWEVFLPFLLFAGSGSIDALLKYNLRFTMSEDTSLIFPFMAWLFFFAACFGLPVARKKTTRVSMPSIVAGCALGIVNIGSIYFLLMALTSGGVPDSVIFPVNNLGVIGISALASFLIFRERLNGFQKTGLLLSALAILMIYMA